MKQYILENGGVRGFPGAEYNADGAALLEGDCEILIPAAFEGCINLGNADRIQANVIIEAANGPVTAAQTKFCAKRTV